MPRQWAETRPHVGEQPTRVRDQGERGFARASPAAAASLRGGVSFALGVAKLECVKNIKFSMIELTMNSYGNKGNWEILPKM